MKMKLNIAKKHVQIYANGAYLHSVFFLFDYYKQDKTDYYFYKDDLMFIIIAKENLEVIIKED